MLKLLLIVVQGKPEGKTIPVVGPVFRVGRGLDCHLRPNSEEVSRNHAEIVLSKTEAVVRDLGSRNGTRVNGKLLTGPHKLKSGELLQIGPLTFAIAIQGVPTEAEEPRLTPTPVGAGVRPGSTSLDDVPADQIDAWLVSDNTKPTPDRPSGVYDGDTLTLESYKEVVNRARQAGSSGSVPTMPTAKPAEAVPQPAAPNPAPQAPAAASKPAPAPKPAAAPAPPASVATKPQIDPEEASPFDAILESIERLPEGTGDGGDSPAAVADEDSATDNEDDGEDEDRDLEEEFVDESNPFYAAKKAAAKGEDPAKPAKPAYQDSSQAASDILKKMLERRRAPR
jgi:pSer/pThr/pTyr-binding forkhead associated (FHA) protein